MLGNKVAIAVHGGAGIICREDVPADLEIEYRQELRDALTAGFNCLIAGDSCLEAAVQSTLLLENCPLFNAGKGSVMSCDGTFELDAGLMCGSTGRAAGATNLKRIKNPIRLAEAILLKTNHCILGGQGAEQFALEAGLEFCEENYFYTESRSKSLNAFLKAGKSFKKGHSLQNDVSNHFCGSTGTVGAVTLDKMGHLASTSSTGGTTGKMPGRLSDTCVPGAGYFANKLLAVSGTGDGDFFLQRNICYRVAALVEYAKMSLKEACEHAIFVEMADCHAGLIALDGNGNAVCPFNTDGMFHAYLMPNEDVVVRIWKNE
ncbi:Asparaginase 2 domain containing protein [Trichuris trichiura]|uniref:Asparaginase 2 domain containing protein n=1 Tax=Trichuris trichiura TaxID=36087 RepID=A0A077ZAQ2_TRITR|nr:Asparaginase 2 domain containing protein [Trichuris trichiura]